MSERTTAILLIAVVALGAMTGVAAADGHLEVAVDDADGEPTATVTENGTAVENATVLVEVVDEENESYAGAGEYETDANGTVELPAAEEDVTVEVTAGSGNDTASATVDLEAPDGLELEVDDTDGEPVVTVTNDDEPVANASVVVALADDADENASYAGTGEYETDENGTVGLPAAEEDVTVNVTAEYENESVSGTVDLTVEAEDDESEAGTPFGQLVREFIEGLEDREGGIGGAVSDFVTENNPGNAPDHAGGPGGPDEADDDDDEADNETDAPGNGNAPEGVGNGQGGPPDHAGNGDDDDDDADETEEDDADEDETEEDDAEENEAEEDDADENEAEEDDEDEEDDEEEADDDEGDDGGPPDHAGGPGGN
jgi:hypothetical protein